MTTKQARITGIVIIASKKMARYWVSQFHVMLDGWFIVNRVLFAAPDAWTLPVPVHPVQPYCVTIDPATGLVTKACIDVPASNQSVLGVGEPYDEETVSMYW